MSSDQETRAGTQAMPPTIEHADKGNAPRSPAVEAAYRLALQQAEAFGPGQVGDCCIACGTRAGIRPVEVVWFRRIGSIWSIASAVTLLLPVHVIWRAPTVAYATYHAMCDACLRSSRRSSLIGRTMAVLGTLALAVGITGLVICFVGYCAGGWEGAGLLPTGGVLAAIGVAGAVMLAQGRSLETTPYLREARAAGFHRIKTRVVADDVRRTVSTLSAEQQKFRSDVENAIAAGNLYALGRVVGSLPEAIRVYGEYCEAKYGPTHVEEVCCRCGDVVDLMDVVAEWRAPVDGNRTTSEGVSVQTYHRMCQRCWGGRFRRSLASWGMVAVEAVLGGPGGLAALAGGIAIFITSGWDRMAMVLTCLGGLAACAIAWWLERRRRRMLVPSRIARIAITPYWFAGVKRVKEQ